MAPKKVPLDIRIKRMSQQDARGCWVWRGRPMNAGYGQMTVRDGGRIRTRLAHRVSYETFVGPIPDGLVIDHVCRNRLCVNPEHLEPVTMRENVMRSPIAVAAANARKTHCANGHPYSPENTYHGVLSNGTTRVRACRTCQSTYRRAAEERRRAARQEAAA